MNNYPHPNPRLRCHQNRSTKRGQAQMDGADDGIRTRDPHLGKVGQGAGREPHPPLTCPFRYNWARFNTAHYKSFFPFLPRGSRQWAIARLLIDGPLRLHRGCPGPCPPPFGTLVTLDPLVRRTLRGEPTHASTPVIESPINFAASSTFGPSK